MKNKKCYKPRCKGKAVRQDGNKNLMCQEHFNQWIKDLKKHQYKGNVE